MRQEQLFNGKWVEYPETEQEWLDLQPEAKLRELFRGDVAGFQRFADRMLDLERRFDRWQREDCARKIGSIAWRLPIQVHP
jgi:hypothetical protein